MSLFGVRYLHHAGPLLYVDGPRQAAAELSAHASCPTWVVEVEHDDRDQVVQVGLPLAFHAGRCSPRSTVWTQPAPASREQKPALVRRRERPRPATVAALISLYVAGKVPAEHHTAAALYRRGWTDITGRDLTDAGRLAAERYRRQRDGASGLVGASS